jgi:type II secretory pathway pseudopilin PulG
MTLIELTVSMALLSIAAVVFLSTLAFVQRAVNTQGTRSVTNDQARLAMEQLDHEIRSGNLLYDPALEYDPDPAHGVSAGMSLRIYTQTNANVRNPGNQCVQWRILDQVLTERHWATNWRDDPAALVTDWVIVADNIQNQEVTPQVSAFALDPDPAKGGRVIVVSLLVNAGNGSASANVLIQESVTGRNTEYGYPSQVCADIPPY